MGVGRLIQYLQMLLIRRLPNYATARHNHQQMMPALIAFTPCQSDETAAEFFC